MSKYWEVGEPTVAETGKNVFSLFEEAGKLQISMPFWLDKEGNKARGKTITVDLKALQESPEAVEVFRRAIGL